MWNVRKEIYICILDMFCYLMKMQYNKDSNVM